MSSTELNTHLTYEELANRIVGEGGDEPWYPPSCPPWEEIAVESKPDWLSIPPIDFDGVDREEIPEEIMMVCAAQPLNDTGNGQRLLTLFGHKLLHVRDVGWHTWVGSHWSRQGGDEAVASLSQRCAALIGAEAEFLTYSKAENADVNVAEDAAQTLRSISRSDQTERQVRQLEARISNGKAAKAAFAKRKMKRRELRFIRVIQPESWHD